MTANKRAGGDGGIPRRWNAGRTRPAAPHHGRWAMRHNMKAAIIILVAVTLLAGCGNQPVSKPTRTPALAGSYYRGDHLGYNIYLNLLPGGKYKAEWHGCLGVYGTARGTWTVVGDKVVFSTSKETDMMRGHLKELHIVQHQGQTVFVPDLQNDYYQKYGPDEYAAFHKQEKK